MNAEAPPAKRRWPRRLAIVGGGGVILALVAGAFALAVNDGKVGDRQVVPQAWIDRIATPAVEALPGWQYSALWWHPPGFAENGDYSAIGVYGQYIYVNPDHDAVVVKLSDYGAEQDEAETIDVFRSLVAGCGRG